MAKIPPQFAKKRAPVQADYPDAAPNAAQDPAMQAARDAMMKKKKGKMPPMTAKQMAAMPKK